MENGKCIVKSIGAYSSQRQPDIFDENPASKNLVNKNICKRNITHYQCMYVCLLTVMIILQNHTHRVEHKNIHRDVGTEKKDTIGIHKYLSNTL